MGSLSPLCGGEDGLAAKVLMLWLARFFFEASFFEERGM